MPFSKGDPNINRAGRPKKGDTLTELLEELSSHAPQDKKIIEDFKELFPEVEPTYKAIIMYRLIVKAVGGDSASIREYFNRLAGLPRQKIEHSGHMLNNLQDILNLADAENDGHGDSGTDPEGTGSKVEA